MLLFIIMIKPKVIFIDWNKTLSNSLFWEHMSRTGNINNAYYKNITKWLFIDNKHLINPWMKGEYKSEDITRMIGEGIRVEPKMILEELATSCINMKLVSDEIPDLVKTIKRKGSKVVVATDNMDTFRRFTIKGACLDNIFDDYLISCEIGYLKGDFGKNGQLKFFEKYMHANNLKYNEVILLDDCIDQTGTMNRVGFKINQITGTSSLVSILRKYAA